jgi:uncharacterized protein YegJ (DUF2314 family)
MRITLIFLTLLSWATIPAEAQSVVERAKAGELAFMSDEEPAMQRAFKKAQETLDAFLQAADQPRRGTEGYALKVAVSDGKNTEYFWVNPFSSKDSSFEGVLANEPRMVKKYKNGQRFKFSRSQIVDWTYMDTTNRRMVGNFTACALLSKEPPEQVKQFKAQYGLQCD